MPTLRELREQAMEKWGIKSNTFDDFPVGTKVKVITPAQDHYFFYGEEGVVIGNSGKRLGIRVRFNPPRQFEDGFVQKEFGFNPEDLVKI